MEDLRHALKRHLLRPCQSPIEDCPAGGETCVELVAVDPAEPKDEVRSFGRRLFFRPASWRVRLGGRSNLRRGRTSADAKVPGRCRRFRRRVLPTSESNQASLPNRWESSRPWTPPSPKEQRKRPDWPGSRMLAIVPDQSRVSISRLWAFAPNSSAGTAALSASKD